MMKERQRRFFPWIIILLALFAFWRFTGREDRVRLDPEAEPRTIIARGDLATDEQNTIELFKAASPSVVNITSIELRRSLFNLNVYEIPQGTGTGFVWDREGRIVTNYHVIEDASRVEVTLADNSIWKGVLVGSAPDKDIAVLQIAAPPEKLQAIPLGESYDLQVGQKVFAIGNPFGLDQTITAGIVSALGREIKAVTGRSIQGVIQTDAAINPGNSGGPLLDSAGRLIGINTAIYSPSGGSAGIGFAVPVAVVNRVVPELIRYGKIIQPGIGISVANDQIARRLHIEGVLIINVHPRSMAAKVGLQGTSNVGGEIVLGDIIEAVNGRPVRTFDDLRNELDRYQIGELVTLDIIRNERSTKIDIELEEVE